MNLIKLVFTIFCIIIFLPVVTYAQQRYNHVKRVKTEKITPRYETNNEPIKINPAHYLLVNNPQVDTTLLNNKLPVEINKTLPHNPIVHHTQLRKQNQSTQPSPSVKKTTYNKQEYTFKKTKRVYTAKPAMETAMLIYIIILVVGAGIFALGLVMQLVWTIPIWGIVVTILGAGIMSVGAAGLIFF